MKSLHFDCINGISGDMVLGAFTHQAVTTSYLKKELKKLPITGYTITSSKVKRSSISANKINIKIFENHHHRTYKDIESLINKSKLSKNIKETSIAIFKTLAVAEGKVHGLSFNKVHFHEVGAVDSIIDIVGTAICLDYLAIETVTSSPLPLGGGAVRCQHGQMPVPAPATLEMISGFKIKKSKLEYELTTPTGAAIVKTLAGKSSSLPTMTIIGSGIGAGSKDFKDVPNILRIIIGETESKNKTKTKKDSVAQIEATIDDSTPEVMGYMIEKILKGRALDAFVTPITMKKNRPAFLLTVLTTEKLRGKLTDIIFRESSTIGLRWFKVDRQCLERESIKVKTKYGIIRVKTSLKEGNIINIAPEYEDCKKIAEKKSIALLTVMNLAISAYKKLKK